MTLNACAEALRQHDPERFGMAMAAAPADRPLLLTLYALNLELARAPYQSAEPMLAEMRLQWWDDRLTEMGQGTAPPLHDVLTPLWAAWGDRAGGLTPLAEARRRDCARLPFQDADQVVTYVDATAGGLMLAATSALGGADAAVVADQARGAGLAAWLRALPQLTAINMGFPLPDPAPARALAAEGLAALDRAARAPRRAVPRRAAAALFAGAGARAVLRDIAAGTDPFAPQPAASEFRRRAALARLALTGHWRT
ncbi:MAG: squalene/phytoene synthase family protein [Paracoccus sp. (in: a-proteobacteria)]|uniref:squalene/phytoene synthase family protein n=1 Tax=Paracoccus sp. TaxID=267 RepID=UPI0026E0CFCB|nr:squalene/phytoene synthase family protein [Paracoccus sp. (in: a-proteobacteria)]MDO5631390.1 squalene/phytoene synthase family protein [Paracoccus sp. (in: a-proteobacteria)]